MSTITAALPTDPVRVSTYRVVGRLGADGMGTVYAALGCGGRRVALRVVHAQLASDSRFRARFRQEVEILRQVDGPCLVPLVDADPEAEPPWLATEYAPGPTLLQRLETRGALSRMQLHLLAAGTASALTAVHAAGVVHRDLKPSNVILSPDGPRLLDAGIAHIADGTSSTPTGTAAGTPGWISPERYRHGSSDAPGDVFAWGALMAYAATGRPPFGTGEPDLIAFRVMSAHPDLNGVPSELLGVIESCLAKKPTHRPPAREIAEDTAELLSRYGRVLGDTPEQVSAVQGLITSQWVSPVMEDPAWENTAARHRRSRAAWVAAAVLAGCAAAAGVWTTGVTLETDVPAGTSTADSAFPTPRDTRPSAEQISAAPPQPTPSAPPPPPPSPRGLDRTQVIALSPWIADGVPSDTVTVTGTVSGSCRQPSAATARRDAWRCGAGSRILDPCFSPVGAPFIEEMLCTATDATRMLRLVLTEPFAAADGNGRERGADPAPAPIVIVLADGNTCRMLTGTTAATTGKRPNYVCDKGGTLSGVLDKSRPVWMIEHRDDLSGTSTRNRIATVHQ